MPVTTSIHPLAPVTVGINTSKIPRSLPSRGSHLRQMHSKSIITFRERSGEYTGVEDFPRLGVRASKEITLRELKGREGELL